MADAATVAEGLGKRFGLVRALDGVDLELPAGDVEAAGWIAALLAATIPAAVARYRNATGT